MNLLTEFERALYEAAEQKIMWYNTHALPKMLESYRTFHSAIRNMIGLFEKKKLLLPDPYKKDKRVVSIALPESDEFTDAEGPTKLGIRLSDYESSLDFLCNYIQFNVESLGPDTIKKLFMFNSFLDWNNLNRSNNLSNNRYFGNVVIAVKNSTDTMSVGLLNNMLSVAAKSIDEINAELKKLTALHRQLYKIDVRKSIFNNPNFQSIYSTLNAQNGLNEIKKVFPKYMGKQRFYPDLIEELVQEDFGSSMESLRKTVLDSFQTELKKEEEKENKVDTRALLFGVIKIMQSFAPPLDIITQKIQENHELLQGESRSAFKKFYIAIRIAFGIQNKTIEYKIKCVDMQTQVEKAETIDYNKFIDGMLQRSRIFSSLGMKNSTLLSKLEGESEGAVLEYVQKRISDCQSLYGTLVGFDNFFKTEVAESNRSKVKGLKIDLDVIKNIILKANKYKAEYVSTVTTEEQMKKLGISNG